MKALTAFIMLMAFAIMVISSAYGNIELKFYNTSRDPAIVEALSLLSETSAAKSGDYILENSVHIIFKNMAELGPSYQTMDALTVIADGNRQIIFINRRHQTAPPHALAALISHEVMHSDKNNSMQEEMAAWTRESQTWEEFLEKYPALKKIGIGQYPLVDRENAIVLLKNKNQLDNEIENNVVYRALPQHSPGF